jgi:hypothetical protein
VSESRTLDAESDSSALALLGDPHFPWIDSLATASERAFLESSLYEYMANRGLEQDFDCVLGALTRAGGTSTRIIDPWLAIANLGRRMIGDEPQQVDTVWSVPINLGLRRWTGDSDSQPRMRPSALRIAGGLFVIVAVALSASGDAGSLWIASFGLMAAVRGVQPALQAQSRIWWIFWGLLSATWLVVGVLLLANHTISAWSFAGWLAAAGFAAFRSQSDRSLSHRSAPRAS